MATVTRNLINTGDPFTTPDGSLKAGATVNFQLVDTDKRQPCSLFDAVTGEYIVGSVISKITDVAGYLPAGTTLWPNNRGEFATLYKVTLPGTTIKPFYIRVTEGEGDLTLLAAKTAMEALQPQTLSLFDTLLASILEVVGTATAVATTVANGLMSYTDKGRLDLMWGKAVYADSYATLAEADEAAVSAGRYLVVTTAWPVVPAQINAPVRVAPGGSFANNSDVLFNSSFEAGLQHVFTGSGDFRFAPGTVPYVPLQWAGADGKATSATGDDTAAFQRVADCCIQGGHEAFALGTFVIKGPVYLSNVTADYQGFSLRGAGRGKTILIEGDGHCAATYLAASGTKGSKMFYCWLNDPTSNMYKFGTFTFRDLTFDKNARSNAPPPVGGPYGPYGYEGSHIIAFLGDAGVASIDGITVERVELKDKSGGGIVIGPCDVALRSLVLRDFQSTDHPTATADPAVWGQRGCVETAIDTESCSYESVTALYAQIEPTALPSPDRPQRYKIANSNIATFEFTHAGFDTDFPAVVESYTYVDISNLTSLTKFLARGLHVTAVNSRLKHVQDHYNLTMNMTNCTWLLPYDAGTKVVTSWYVSTPSLWVTLGMTPVANMVNCKFLIDAETVDPTCTGVAVRSNVRATLNARIKLTDCEFDPRLYGTVDAYAQSGVWKFNHCKLAGHTQAVGAGTYNTYYSSVELNDCDFSAVTGTKLKVTHGTANYQLKVRGAYLASEWSQTYATSLANSASYIEKPKLLGSAAPATGTWFVGDRVWNTTPAAGGAEGWVCTTGGTSGTWKAFGTIAA